MLVVPLFRLDYPEHWNREDGARISDIHYLRQHWPRPGWQPFWFSGIRFDAIYPPLLRYAGAGVARWRDDSLQSAESARAYWFVIACGLIAGASGFWLLVRLLTGSRGAALWAGSAALLVSPCTLFLADVRADTKAPFRVDVSARYGDGPHVFGLGLALFSLAAAWWAFRANRRVAAVLAGCGAAGVLATDLHAALSFVFLLFWLAWSDWLERQRSSTWRQSAIIVAIGLGLNAWWLTPGRLAGALAILWRNCTTSSLWTPWVAAGLLLLLLLISERFFRGFRSGSGLVFAFGAAAYFVFDVATGFYTPFLLGDIVSRFIPETDLLLLLLAAVSGSLLWNSNHRPRRILLVALAVMSLLPAVKYLRAPWATFPASAKAAESTERAAAETVARQANGRRFFFAGRLESWSLLWDRTPQVGGGLDPSTLDLALGAAYLRTLRSDSAGYIEKWTRVFAVDGLVVPTSGQEAAFGSFRSRDELSRRLRNSGDLGQPFMILVTPRRDRGLADVIRTKDLEGISDADLLAREADLDRYVRALDEGPRATAKLTWHGPNQVEVQGRLGSGEAFWLAVRHDSGWEAYVGMNPAEVHRAPGGLMWVSAPPGEQRVRLYYRHPLAQKVGLLVAACTLLLAGVWLFRPTVEVRP